MTRPNLVERLMRSPAGAIVARPWFDPVALHVIIRRYLPLSRAWAAALAAGGSVERFLAAAPVADASARVRDRVAPALERIARLGEAAAHAAGRWEDAAFGAGRCEGAARSPGLSVNALPPRTR